MDEIVGRLVDTLNELDEEEQGIALCALVAGFIDAVTDGLVDAYCELAAFNASVAELLGEHEEVMH